MRDYLINLPSLSYTPSDLSHKMGADGQSQALIVTRDDRRPWPAFASHNDGQFPHYQMRLIHFWNQLLAQ
jgi:hypothetical protein